jgi:hypothetical protein
MADPPILQSVLVAVQGVVSIPQGHEDPGRHFVPDPHKPPVHTYSQVNCNEVPLNQLKGTPIKMLSGRWVDDKGTGGDFEHLTNTFSFEDRKIDAKFYIDPEVQRKLELHTQGGASSFVFQVEFENGSKLGLSVGPNLACYHGSIGQNVRAIYAIKP